jgi:hypothetical protein
MVIDKQEPLNKRRPPQPFLNRLLYENLGDHSIFPIVSEYERWAAARDLREILDRKLEESGYDRDWRPRTSEHQLKSQFLQEISDLSDVWGRAIRRLRRILWELQRRSELDMKQ